MRYVLPHRLAPTPIWWLFPTRSHNLVWRYETQNILLDDRAAKIEVDRSLSD
ncbi:MAG: hypothetical protein KME17_24905 [Cyanosarcina radialis HA8281-LM2]|nr:hypothetical protein [Cyanosarcina radialis HA8281-LM2]